MDGLRRSWRIGPLHRADATVVRKPSGEMELVVRWRPSMPQRPSGEQLSAYVIGRDRALRELEAEAGVRLMLRAAI